MPPRHLAHWPPALPRHLPLPGDGSGMKHVIVPTYSDHLSEPTDLRVPDFVAAPRTPIDDSAAIVWHDMLASDLRPGPLTQGARDLCVMPYTSGTTGHPKG